MSCISLHLRRVPRGCHVYCLYNIAIDSPFTCISPSTSVSPEFKRILQLQAPYPTGYCDMSFYSVLCIFLTMQCFVLTCSFIWHRNAYIYLICPFSVWCLFYWAGVSVPTFFVRGRTLLRKGKICFARLQPTWRRLQVASSPGLPPLGHHRIPPFSPGTPA